MKIFGQDIPELMRDLYMRYVATNQAEKTIARTRRAVKLPQRKRPNRTNLKDITRVVDLLAQLIKDSTGATMTDGWKYLRRKAIRSGKIEEEFWLDAELHSERTYESLPTSEPDLNPPPYDYRTPGLGVSKTTYPDGQVSTGAPRYSGAMTGEHFTDASLKWNLTVWRLELPITDILSACVFIKHAHGLYITTDKRGSRPMFSFMSRLKAGADPAQLLGDATPPTSKATSFYWRFKPPLTQPPFFAAEQERLGIQTLPHINNLGEGLYLSVALSPRPMWGKANNNSGTVAVDMAPSLRVLVPKIEGLYYWHWSAIAELNPVKNTYSGPEKKYKDPHAWFEAHGERDFMKWWAPYWDAYLAANPGSTYTNLNPQPPQLFTGYQAQYWIWVGFSNWTSWDSEGNGISRVANPILSILALSSSNPVT